MSFSSEYLRYKYVLFKVSRAKRKQNRFSPSLIFKPKNMVSSTAVFCHKWYTVNSRLADTSLLRTPRYYGQQQNPRRKLQTFDWNKLSLLRTLATTDLQTLYSVPTSQFYYFLSRYSEPRAASWSICTYIRSIFFGFLRLFSLVFFGRFPLLLSINQNSLTFFFLRPSLKSRCHE